MLTLNSYLPIQKQTAVSPDLQAFYFTHFFRNLNCNN